MHKKKAVWGQSLKKSSEYQQHFGRGVKCKLRWKVLWKIKYAGILPWNSALKMQEDQCFHLSKSGHGVSDGSCIG